MDEILLAVHESSKIDPI